MQVFASYGLVHAVARTFGSLWKSIGRPDLVTKLSMLRVVLIVIFIYPLTAEFGILGTAITVTEIFVFPMMPLDIVITSRTADVPIRDILYEFVFPLLASLPMALVVWFLCDALQFSVVFELPILVTVGVVVYAVVLLLEVSSDWNVTDNFQRVVRNLS